MMESLGLRCGKSIALRSEQLMKKKKPMLQISRACVKTNIASPLPPPSLVSSSASAPSILTRSLEQQQQKNKMTTDKLDEWMRDSVSEIVRHIGEAPFLVHLYSPTTKNTTSLEMEMDMDMDMEREKVIEDSWSSVRRRWKEGCPIPEGVILVEQLDQEKHQEEEYDPTTTAATGTRAWGVLIQGKGVDTVACYILKTCRVWSSFGFCTHFCLIKAKCFGETAELQLQNSWNGINNHKGFSEL